MSAPTLPVTERTAWPGPVRRWDTLVTALRVTLGTVFLIAGLKTVFPPLVELADHTALADKFTQPVTGFIAPWLAERITSLGIPLDTFMLVKGIADTLMGLALIVGLGTRMNAAVIGLLLCGFTFAAPEAGGVRLARDLALAVLVLALVYTGPGRWSLDRRIAASRLCLAEGGSPPRRALRALFRSEALPAAHRDRALLLLRIGLAIPLLTSAVFAGGPEGIFDNPQNTLLPQPVLLLLGGALLLGLAPRYAMAAVAVLMAWLVVKGLVEHWFYPGLDGIKREIPMLAAAAVYALAGPDHRSLPRPKRVRCREVNALLSAYADGSLSPGERAAMERHFSDCPECWRYLASYQETTALGRRLRDDTIPEDVQTRLLAFVAEIATDRRP
ncbi:zf-HC2 domain-containing protein [Streptomyces sp. O3]